MSDSDSRVLLEAYCWCRCGHSDKDHRLTLRRIFDDGTLSQFTACQVCWREHPFAFWKQCREFRDSGRPMRLVYADD